VIAALLLALTSLLASTATAHAHQVNLSTARIVVAHDRSVDVEIALKGSDVDRAAGTFVFDNATGLVRPAALAAAAAPVTGYVRGHTALTGAEGVSCRSGAGEVVPDGDGVVVRMRWFCADASDPLRYRSTVLIDVSPDAKQVVLIGAGPDTAQNLLDATRNETALTAASPPSLLQVIARYIGAGIEHIFVGYDHVAFLIAIVLWARRLTSVIKIVTAFTLAHSLTLSLAALDIVRIPNAIVEPAIAASIVYVAVENFLSRDVAKRWRIAFAFGLIHGFGFASALQEFGLPQGALILALASFNGGVEIGQLVIVSLALPALLLLDRWFASPGAERAAPMVYAVSGIICLLGTYWLVIRTLIA
jgi:hydrogenase/urease accessory protein HupE